jgi:hypothetical protein
MNRLRIVALCFVVYSTEFAYAQGDSGKNKPAKAAKADKESTSDLRGTAQSPAIVEIVGPANGGTEAKQDKDEKASHGFKEGLAAWSTFALACLTLLLAGATGVLARYTWRLWKTTGEMMRKADEASAKVLTKMGEQRGAMNEQKIAMVQSANETLTHLQESSERELRAYVHVETVDLGFQATPTNGFPSLDWLPQAQVQIRNAGKTPATDVIHLNRMFACINTPVPESFGSHEALPESSRDVLGPGVGSGSLVFLDNPLSQSDVATIATGASTIIVIGSIFYTDAFKRPRETHYRYFFTKRPIPPKGTIRLTTASTGNTAT